MERFIKHGQDKLDKINYKNQRYPKVSKTQNYSEIFTLPSHSAPFNQGWVTYQRN